MINNFNQLNLEQALKTSLEQNNFVEPTPIQAQSIPHALNNEDVIASAQTGTGKTLSFVIPMINKMMQNPEDMSVILMPTRELALQISAVVKQILSKGIKLEVATLIGGEDMGKQLRELKRGANIIVGTPGRINDHLNRRSLKLFNATFLTLDETDRMLDMGFGIQIDSIIEQMNPQHQTLMFSATLPKNIMKLADKYLNTPKKIEIEVQKQDLDRISQEFLHIGEEQKLQTLLQELEGRSGSVILFAKTKSKVEKLTKALRGQKHDADYIHGGLKQNKRAAIIKKYRQAKFRIMVATDVAARGLDVDHIEHVINYDLPQEAEDYIHRIGRTGRAGKSGSSLSLVAHSDQRYFYDIQYLLDPTAEKPKSMPRPKRAKKPFSNDKRRTGGRDDRKPRGEGRGEGRKFDDRKPRGEGRKFDDRKPRGEGRKFDDSKPRGEGRKFDDSKPRGEGRKFDDRKPRGEGRKFDDRKPRGEGRKFDDRKPRGEGRKFDDSKPRGEGRKFDDSKPRGEGRKPSSRGNGFGDKPKGGSRGGNSKGPRKSFK